MLKDIIEKIKEIGIWPVIALLLIILGIILVSNLPEITSFNSVKNLETKQILAIVVLIVGFIGIYAVLIKQQQEIDTAKKGNSLTKGDKKILMELASLFERKAFMNANAHEEDLRALFSAANETRIEISKRKNKIGSEIVRKLLDGIYDDFNLIREMNPSFSNQIIPSFDPDAVGVWPNQDRAQQDRSFIDDIWGKTDAWNKYIEIHPDIGKSGYYPYIAIVDAVKRKLRFISHMKDIILRII